MIERYREKWKRIMDLSPKCFDFCHIAEQCEIVKHEKCLIKKSENFDKLFPIKQKIWFYSNNAPKKAKIAHITHTKQYWFNILSLFFNHSLATTRLLSFVFCMIKRFHIAWQIVYTRLSSAPSVEFLFVIILMHNLYTVVLRCMKLILLSYDIIVPWRVLNYVKS